MNGSDLNFSKYKQQKKKKGLVWKFFKKISHRRVRCRLCNHEQNYQGTTGNIHRHLKSRHNLDATRKGLQDPPTRQRIKELSEIISAITMANNIDRKAMTQIRKTSLASDSSGSMDSYNNTGNNYENLERCDMFNEDFPDLQEEFLMGNNIDDTKGQERKSAKRLKLEEDLILAETEYFREKAAYFRLQKHFSALQAKKVKLELEYFALNNKNET